MYNKEALKRVISKKGVKETLKLLSSPTFPEEIKKALSKDGIFNIEKEKEKTTFTLNRELVIKMAS